MGVGEGSRSTGYLPVSHTCNTLLEQSSWCGHTTGASYRIPEGRVRIWRGRRGAACESPCLLPLLLLLAVVVGGGLGKRSARRERTACAAAGKSANEEWKRGKRRLKPWKKRKKMQSRTGRRASERMPRRHARGFISQDILTFTLRCCYCCSIYRLPSRSFASRVVSAAVVYAYGRSFFRIFVPPLSVTEG